VEGRGRGRGQRLAVPVAEPCSRTNLHVQALCDAVYTAPDGSSERGIGILEQLAIGVHPSGLTGIFDPYTAGRLIALVSSPAPIAAIAFATVKKPTVAERRNEILETTCAVVIERGFAGTRIADVAKRLEVSSSLIHYHFDSKEQLLAEAFDYYANKDVAETEGEMESAPTALGKLERVIQNYVPEGSDDVEWMLWIDGWGEALRKPDDEEDQPAARRAVDRTACTCDPRRRRFRRVHLPRSHGVGHAPHRPGRWSGRAVRGARRHGQP
jgi:AcrR family transcriptional regulator